MDGEELGQGGGWGAPPIHLEMVNRGRVEVMSGVARRRRWSAGEKAQITRESFAPGASVSDVARRHAMSLGLLHHWRRVVRRSAGEVAQSFVPVVAAEENDLSGSAARAGEGVIEIAFCGAPLSGIDAAMSVVLKENGYEGAFLRPVFHGVGTEHEEAPIPGGHAIIHGEEKVEAVETGMALAVGNCGIYQGSFGLRAEDTIWVSPGGPVPLTKFPKVAI